jgi:rhodanese-related sulfurtransferase
MLLSACSQTTEEVVATEVDSGDAGETDGGDEVETEVDLDAAFETFLADMEGYNTIGLEGLNEMLAEEPPPFVLDVREYSEIEENGRIETAVVIPLRDLPQNLDLLPSFDTTIVSYCGSGWRCTIALTALEAMGWQNVLGLKGGSYGGWVEAGYATVEGLAEEVALNAADPDAGLVEVVGGMLAEVPDGFGVITADDLNIAVVENPDLILIDVRRAEELEENGLIEGAIPIPLESFIANMADWPTDYDAPIVIYCGSGHRSTIAMTIMWTYGFTDVKSLKGGFSGWVEAGYPVAEAVAQ